MSVRRLRCPTCALVLPRHRRDCAACCVHCGWWAVLAGGGSCSWCVERLDLADPRQLSLEQWLDWMERLGLVERVG